MKKGFFRNFLVVILITMIIFNFLISIGNVVYAADDDDGGEDIGSLVIGTLSNIVSGLLGILLWPITLPPTVILIGVSEMIGSIARLGFNNIKSYNEKGLDYTIITPFHILFNKIPLLDVNFFQFNGVSDTILMFRQNVAGWYYTMRLIASMILLVILLYLGLRMAITSIATEKAIYKKMLVDWVTSLCLLFLLHYIMIFILACNNVLVDAMEGISENVDGIDTMMTNIILMCFVPDLIMRIGAIIIFGMLVFQTISFLISYIKRMFTIGFLIIIAPLITITYSIDKIGDGKSQALNTWLKEFSYNILLQPFQCILYLVFANLAYNAMCGFSFKRLTTNNIGVCVFAILSLQFVKEGEKIVKKIFGFGKASTVGDLAVGAAVTAGALMKGKDIAKKYGGAVAKTKNKIIGSKAGDTMRNYFNSKDFKDSKIGKATDALSKAKDTLAHYTSFGFLPKDPNSNSDNNSKDSKSDNDQQRFTSDTKLSDKSNASSEDESNSTGTQPTDAPSESPETEQKNAPSTPGGDTGKKQSESRDESARDESARDEAAENEKAKDEKAKDEKAKDDKAKKKNKDINGASGRMSFGSALAKASGEAILGIRDFAWDHKKDIRGMTVGMFTAGIGLAAGDFGDISKGIAGYGMGKGFSEGIYAYSTKQLKEDSEAAMKMISNLGYGDNPDAVLAQANLEGLNKLSDKINDAISNLEKKMELCNVDASMLGDFTDKAQSKTEAGTITKDLIDKMLDKHGFKEHNGYTKEDAIKQYSELGKLLGYQTLFNNIQNAEAMEIDRETLAQWLGGTGYSKETLQNSGSNDDSTGVSGDSSQKSGSSNTGGNSGDGTDSQQEIHEEYDYREIIDKMEPDELENKIKEMFPDLQDSSIQNLEIEQTNTRIEQLNKLITELNAKISDSNTSNTSQYERIRSNIQDKLSRLESRKQALEQQI